MMKRWYEYLRTVTKVKMPNIESENLILILRGDLCSGTETNKWTNQLICHKLFINYIFPSKHKNTLMDSTDSQKEKLKFE